MKESQILDAMGALSQKTRLRIIRHLISSGDEGDTAGGIGEAVNASPSKASFHLAALERARLVKSRRLSRNIIYRANYTQLGKVINYLLCDCCQNNPAVLACCDMKVFNKYC